MEFEKIRSKADSDVFIKVAQGHFATNHSHISQYVNLTDMKVRLRAAKKVAALLAAQCSNVQIDSIICLEGTNMIGAFIAEEISQRDPRDSDICVVMPDSGPNNEMMFYPNKQKMVRGKSVLLLLASISTGKTIERAHECLNSYDARIAAVCAGFSAISELDGEPIKSVFTIDDLSDYHTFLTNECDMCKSGRRIDAIVNAYGFTPL